MTRYACRDSLKRCNINFSRNAPSQRWLGRHTWYHRDVSQREGGGSGSLAVTITGESDRDRDFPTQNAFTSQLLLTALLQRVASSGCLHEQPGGINVVGMGQGNNPLRAISKHLKSKGLQKLRWYCQLCEKQCRDENGFKCNCASENHLRRVQLFGSNPKRVVDEYSIIFEHNFIKALQVS